MRQDMSRCGGNHANPTTQTPPTGAASRVTYQSISINAKESGIRLNSPVPSAWMSSGTSVWVRTASVMWQRALASERPGMRNTTAPVSVTSLLEEICRLLKETDLPIGEIATRCGFPVQTHLNAIFRRNYGTTLRAYRQSSKST